MHHLVVVKLPNSRLYLSIKAKDHNQGDTLKLIEYNEQLEGTVEIDELKLNTNYTVRLVERGEFLNANTLASPIELFMPSDIGSCFRSFSTNACNARLY